MMIDLTALAGLFFEASQEWTEPKVAKIDPLSAIDDEPKCIKLKRAGHVYYASIRGTVLHPARSPLIAAAYSIALVRLRGARTSRRYLMLSGWPVWAAGH